MKEIFKGKIFGVISFSCFVFLYAPILIVVVNAFNKSKLGYKWEGFTLEWFEKLIENQMLVDALKNSVQVALFSSFVASIFGTAAAISLVRGSMAYKKVFSSLIKLPLILPDIVLGISSLALFTIIAIPLGIESIVIAHITFCSSFVALVVSARVAALNKSIELAAADLGASSWQVFYKVTLPQIYPSVFAGALLAFTLSLDDYVISSFTAGVGGTTLPIRIYSMIKFGITPEVCALSVILLLVSLILAICVSRVDQSILLRK